MLGALSNFDIFLLHLFIFFFIMFCCYIFLRRLFFSNKRREGSGSGGYRKWGETGRRKGRGNLIKNMLCEKIIYFQ